MKPSGIIFIAVIILVMISCAKDNEAELPRMSTLSIKDISSTKAKSGGVAESPEGYEIIIKGLVWSREKGPSVEKYSGISYAGTVSGLYFSELTGLVPDVSYFVRAYATNRSGTAYGEQLSFKTLATPEVITDTVTIWSKYDVAGGGNVISEGASPVTERGIVFGLSNNPDLSDFVVASGSGKGRFIVSMSGLLQDTLYFVRSYATNSYGTAYGNQVYFIIPGLKKPPIIQHCINNRVLKEVVSPLTGKVWMDRNLWAEEVAEFERNLLSYGDLYQWGRRPDLHQCRNSGTKNILANSDNPGSLFILTESVPNDWRYTAKNSLWQGINGSNNPCPFGFRLPSSTELEAERKTWSSQNTAGALDSPLKLPAAGARSHKDGSIENAGDIGYYWTSTVVGEYSHYLKFNRHNAGMHTNYRAYGYSARCIKN